MVLAIAGVGCVSPMGTTEVTLDPAEVGESGEAEDTGEVTGDADTAGESVPDDEEEPAGPTQADILFVMDNTSSMAYASQYEIATAAYDFVSTLIKQQVDFHIAVTTTDVGADPSVPEPENGAFLGPVLTRDDWYDLEAQLRAGYDGGSIEAGLQAGLTALTDTERLGDQIGEFRREGATLAVVFITDEEDASFEPANVYLRQYLGLSGAEARSQVRLFALVTQDPADCGGESGRTLGTRLADVATQSGGHADNLLGEAGPLLERLAAAIAEAPNPGATCTLAIDCPVDHHCDAGSCVPGCAADTDCLSGESCDAGTCEPGACRTTPLDCRLGEMCDGNTGTCFDGGGCEPCSGVGDACGMGECVNFGDENTPEWYCLQDCAVAYDNEACPRGFDCRDLSGVGDLYCYAECPMLAPLLVHP